MDLVFLIILSLIIPNSLGDNLRKCWTNSHNNGHCFNLGACRQWHPRESHFRQCLGHQGLVCCQRPQLAAGGKISGLRSINSLLNEMADQQSFANQDFKSSCGLRDTSNFFKFKHRFKRVVGGHDVATGHHPWFAGLMYKEWLICGATLISDRLLVTAAHCVLHKTKVRRYKVILGSTSVGSGQAYDISANEIHPDYKDWLPYNDIAIMVTDRPVMVSGSSPTRAACLPTFPMTRILKFLNNRFGTIVGFGTLYFNGPIPTTVQEATVPLIDNKKCAAIYGRGDRKNKTASNVGGAGLVDGSELAEFFVDGWSESLLCAGYGTGEVDACQGDSGGPLLISINGRWTLIGIISIGFRCAEPGFPGIYTRISAYVDWIHKIQQDYK